MTAIDFEALAEPFPADEIEWRVGNRAKSGEKASLLCYLTSRAVQARLDEVVGPARWRDAYTPLYEGPKIIGFLCELSIQVESGVWVSKVDAADVTDVEATKGGISSALKRAAVKWGIGRYLYGVDSRYYPIVKGYGPDDAVYCPLADKSAGHILRPKLPDSALPKAKGKKPKKGDPIDTTPTPEDQALADRIAAEKKAAAEKADAERLALHDPSWTPEAQRSFCGSVSTMLHLNVDHVMELGPKSPQGKRPSQMTKLERIAYYRWLDSDVGRLAYDGFVANIEMGAMGAA